LYLYDPATASEIHAGADSVSHIASSDQLEKYLARALIAAEGQADPRGPIRATIANLLSGSHPRGQMYSWRLARELAPKGHSIRRQIDELRLADQIHRHFNQRQVMTIYLNRVYLGENSYGVEDASLRYFGKHASDLSLDEAALLAGLIRSPNHDSPIGHPERAIERRNWVIDHMASQGWVTHEDAEHATAAPLIVKQTPNSEATYDWSRCALKIINHVSADNTTIRVRAGEKSTKYPPVIVYEVLESGEVRNAIVQRSSGISDIDNYALAGVKTMRYNERPPGCGIIQSEAVVSIDLVGN
jgi:membrane peptidoglycan carboxypeptidase